MHCIHISVVAEHAHPRYSACIRALRGWTIFQALLNLSQEQLEDLERLRLIYFTRRAVLAKERESLVRQALKCISTSQQTVPLPGHSQVGAHQHAACGA